MRYTKFSVQNFKGIKSLELDLTVSPAYRATTLVGLNESGKTTILEAINLIQKDFDEELSYLLIPRSSQYKFSEPIVVTATLELDADDNVHLKKEALSQGFNLTKDTPLFTITKTYNFNRANFVPPIITAYDAMFIGKNKKAKADTPEKRLTSSDPKYIHLTDFINKKLRPPIIYYPNFLADFPEKIYLKQSPKKSARQTEYRRVLQDILDALGGGLNLDEDILQRIERGTDEDKSALESLLSTMGERITNDVFGAWKKILRPGADIETLSGIKITVSSDIDQVTDDAGIVQPIPYVTMKVRDGAESYHISERSLGFKWFFSYFLFTEFRKHRAADRGEILFLIDEPASNLHSTAQQKLLETFGELVKKSRLMYTTHSHHLINSDWLEGAYIVQNKALDYDKELAYNSSRTDIEAVPYRQFVAEHPNKQTYFQPILDTLEYKPSLLENVPDMVIVEGKNDFYTLQYINKVFKGNSYDGLHLCPSNGVGGNETPIQLYIAWGRNFIVLTDGDSAGQKAKEKYIEKFGTAVEGRVFTLADIQPSFKGKAMESLFSSEAERIRITQEIFPRQKSYSKDKFNQAIQNLLFLKQEVKLNKLSSDNLTKVLEFLNEKLSAD